MARRQNRPLGRRIQARMMRVINVPMRIVLGLPLATPLSGRLMLVFLTGGKTGRSYRQPVSYVRQGTTLLTPGGGKWKLNLQAGRPEPVRLRGRDVLARPELVGDIDEVERLLAVMTAANPRVSTFVAIPTGADGHLDRARLETAVKYGYQEPAHRRNPHITRHQDYTVQKTVTKERSCHGNRPGPERLDRPGERRRQCCVPQVRRRSRRRHRLVWGRSRLPCRRRNAPVTQAGDTATYPWSSWLRR